MEVILLGIYAFFVWLIFIKLKLLPWTTPFKVAVAIIPVVGLATTMLLLNIFAPTTTDVRVVKYIVPIVSQVKGRVIEVPVENNRRVKKGDVLFRIDPTPYQGEVRSLEAQLASAEAKVGADQTRIAETQARMTDARSGERQLGEQLNQATGQVTFLQGRSNWQRNVWRRTRSLPPPAPGIASIWSRRRRMSMSSRRRSPRRTRPGNR
jgi:multidrug resistance efflux pump